MGATIRKVGRRAMERVGLIGPYYRLLERRLTRQAQGDEFDDGLPMPPGGLITLVSGPDRRWFSERGAIHADKFEQLAEAHGAPLAGGRVVLDFGCGCGRIARWLAPRVTARGGRFLGCDVNPRLVGWAAANLPGEYLRNAPRPPMPYADGSADVLYAHSVLTHLTRASAAAWLDDFARVLRPGGLAIVTFHDEEYAARWAPPQVAPRLQADGYYVLNNALEGSNYMAAWVTRDHLAAMVEARFEPLEIRGGEFEGSEQAVAVLRRR